MYRVYIDKRDNYMVQIDVTEGERSGWVSSPKEELSALFIVCNINNYINADFLELLIESTTLITKYTHPELFI